MHVIVCLIQMQFNCKMSWCKNVQACPIIIQESTCIKFSLHQMSQIPNVDGLLNHLAQQKLMIAAGHVFQRAHKATPPGECTYLMSGWRLEIRELPVPAIVLLTHPRPIFILDYWLAAFTLEARRQDGNYYPGDTQKYSCGSLSFPEGERGSKKMLLISSIEVREKPTSLTCT